MEKLHHFTQKRFLQFGSYTSQYYKSDIMVSKEQTRKAMAIVEAYAAQVEAESIGNAPVNPSEVGS